MVVLTTQAIIQSVAMHPSFLYASIFPLAGKVGLSVYRSTALPTTDEWYKPVKSFLGRHSHLLLESQIVEDSSMMFGEAISSIYEVKESVWQK